MTQVHITGLQTRLRKRVQIDCSKPVLTDQSGKKAADINNIMAQYAKTGLLPETRDRIAQYVDNTNTPSLEQAHELITNARNLFLELPAPVRKLMDNNPANLVEFISNPENREYLEKHGVLNKKPQQVDVVSDVKPVTPQA